MKIRIAFFGLLMLCIFNGNAQKKAETDWKNTFLVSSGTYFDSKVTDEKWGNINGKSYTSAKYSEYSGLTHVKLSAAKTMSVSLNFEIELSKGALEMRVVDSNNNIVFMQYFKSSKTGNANLDLKEGEDYQIIFDGKQAKGSYFCQWKEN